MKNYLLFYTAIEPVLNGQENKEDMKLPRLILRDPNWLSKLLQNIKKKEPKLLTLYTDKQIDDMRPAGQFSAELLDLIEPHIKPGITTLEINEIIHEHTSKHGYISAPLNYHGSLSLCAHR